MGMFPKVLPLVWGLSLFFEKEVVPWGTSPFFRPHLYPSFRVRKIIPHIIPKGDLLNSQSLYILGFH